jgi:hypothetical protein
MAMGVFSPKRDVGAAAAALRAFFLLVIIVELMIAGRPLSSSSDLLLEATFRSQTYESSDFCSDTRWNGVIGSGVIAAIFPAALSSESHGANNCSQKIFTSEKSKGQLDFPPDFLATGSGTREDITKESPAHGVRR